MANDKVMKKNDHNALIKAAIKSFWETKQKQLTASGDSSNRGAVVGGKQLDAFADLLKTLAIEQGVPEECIYTSQAYLPGYFRSSKDWDFLIIAPNKKLIAAVELKSQIGSYGNNFNNRAEEVIGLARDFQTAYREKAFGLSPYPWLGYFFLLEDTEPSRKTVKLAPSPLPPMRKFNNTSYQDRYRLLCEALILERDFSATSLLLARKPSETAGALYSEPRPDLSFSTFCKSFFTHILAQSNA